jgi:hypothetical protein
VTVNGPATADITLTGAHALTGVVSGSAGPLSGVSVNVYTADTRTWVKNAVSTGDGYTLSGLPAGSYKLYIQPNEPGYANRWHGGLSFEAATTVTVPGATGVDIALAAGHTLSGVVSVGTAGLAGVVVNMYTADTRTWVKNATTDADGRYSLAGLEARDYKIYIHPNEPGHANRWHGGASFETATPVTVGGPTSLDLTLGG